MKNVIALSVASAVMIGLTGVYAPVQAEDYFAVAQPYNYYDELMTHSEPQDYVQDYAKEQSPMGVLESSSSSGTEEGSYASEDYKQLTKEDWYFAHDFHRSIYAAQFVRCIYLNDIRFTDIIEQLGMVGGALTATLSHIALSSVVDPNKRFFIDVASSRSINEKLTVPCADSISMDVEAYDPAINRFPAFPSVVASLSAGIFQGMFVEYTAGAGSYTDASQVSVEQLVALDAHYEAKEQGGLSEYDFLQWLWKIFPVEVKDDAGLNDQAAAAIAAFANVETFSSFAIATSSWMAESAAPSPE